MGLSPLPTFQASAVRGEDAGEKGSQVLTQVLRMATGIGGGTFRNFRQEAWV